MFGIIVHNLQGLLFVVLLMVGSAIVRAIKRYNDPVRKWDRHMASLERNRHQR